MRPSNTFALVCALTLLACPVSAQSVITLDDFDLGDGAADRPAEGSKQESGIALCLRDPRSCEEGSFKSSVAFSIDDVVNIGIIDREEVDETRVSANPDRDGAAAAVVLPSIDLEVLFDSNSDSIRADQIPQLVDLAEVLRDGDFDGYKLIFMGHTDAKGSAEYNLELSRRRAQSVAAFVTSAAALPESLAQSVGLGFTRLADPENPLAANNRRVQLVLVPVR